MSTGTKLEFGRHCFLVT